LGMRPTVFTFLCAKRISAVTVKSVSVMQSASVGLKKNAVYSRFRFLWF